jgi:hypothetical protein
MEDIEHRNTRPNPNTVLNDNELGDKAIGMNTHIITDPVSSLHYRMSANTDIMADSIVLSDENAMPRPQPIPNPITGIDNRMRADNSVISDN